MSRTQELKAKLAKKEQQLELAEATYEKLLSDPNESYRFDSGDGSQSTKKRKLDELKTQIDQLESEIDNLKRRLAGKGLTRVSLRRKGCHTHRDRY